MPAAKRTRPGVGTEAGQKSNGVAAADGTYRNAGTDTYPVTGTFVVDLTDRGDLTWPEYDSFLRRGLWDLEHLPAGAHVRLMVGDVVFVSSIVAGLDIGHVSITVESSNALRIRQWVQGLREARA